MFEQELHALREKNLLRRLKVSGAMDGIRATLDGRLYRLFCTNDYLGLSGHTEVRAAAKAAIDGAGTGAGSAPLISGYTSYHQRLADDIARFKGAEAGLLFGSGYVANTSIIPALAGAGDAVFSDELNHASIVVGCRLSRADKFIYRHRDMDSLEALLKADRPRAMRFIVTEGVFSMDGDVAPMPDIMVLARRYNATVILDDAHGTGVLGCTGRGTLEHYGLPADNVIQVGTLGKALGSYGAFAAASPDVIDWLVNGARGFMFSTSLPASVCAAASASLAVIGREPERLVTLRRNAGLLRDGLRGLGFTVLGEDTPIVPLVVGDAGHALALSAALMDAGFYAPAIRPPTVPEGGSRVRFTVSALHTEEDIRELVESVRRAIR
ncbi:MAG: 8-amino-7-oxononanoate synthase [Nitrospirae bacterium]|nr:8-amino-7-oxononanoate synthase [Nitrospirota bacterium]